MSEESVIERFGSGASTYDRPHTIAFATRFVQNLQSLFSLPQPWRCLDFGCGTASASFLLSPFVHSVTCVDNAKGMIDVVVQKKKEHGPLADNIHPVHLTLQDPSDLGEASFDLAFTTMTLHHIKDAESTIKLLGDCLRPGGMLVIADLLRTEETHLFHTKIQNETDVKHPRGFAVEEVAEWHQSIGMKWIGHRTMPHVKNVSEDGNPPTITKVFPIFISTAVKLAIPSRKMPEKLL